MQVEDVHGLFVKLDKLKENHWVQPSPEAGPAKKPLKVCIQQ